MQPVQLSSGDLVADRRAAYAEMLFESGDRAAAADLMRDTLALAPGWTAGWYRLGEMLHEAGRQEEAAGAWRETLRLDPEDRLGATLRLGLLDAGAQPDAVPPAFVEALFDQYADSFEESLVEKLDYRVPSLLTDAIMRLGRGCFGLCVDLGCGTGLMGEHLRAVTGKLEGVDISGGMLKRAGAKNIYDRLVHADLNDYAMPTGADLVTAADVFIYVGALDTLIGGIAAALPMDGVLAFSVERHGGPEDMALRRSRRFAHSETYVRALLEPAFRIASIERATIRMDAGEPVEGLIVVALRK